MSRPPLLGESPKVLILSAAAGADERYYSGSQDRFWDLLGSALEEKLGERPYAERLEALKRRGVALWDVLARRDPETGEAEPNGIGRLLRDTGVRAVFLNGGKAEAAFREHSAEGLPAGARAVRLPSSSAADRSLTYDEKLQAWRQLAAYLA